METVSKDELEKSFEGPAIRVNRFYVSIALGSARIGFLEQSGPGSPPHFRVAVSMSVEDAIALSNLLNEMTKPK